MHEINFEISTHFFIFIGLAYNTEYDFTSTQNFQDRRADLRPLALDISTTIKQSLIDIIFLKASNAGVSCPKLTEEFKNLVLPSNVVFHENLMASEATSNSYCGVLFDGVALDQWRVTTPTPGQKNA